MSAIQSAISTTGTTGSSSTTGTSSSTYNLTAQDFISMMVTQLQNQDPLSPTSNQDLLAQMSSIGQLQASTQSTSTLQSMQLQTQIGSASSLIGKTVDGIDSTNATVSGIVSSVQVAGGNVTLQLANGSNVALTNISSITSPTSTSSSTTSN